MSTTLILNQLTELNDARKKNDPAAREQMLIAAQALVTSLQSPSDFISSIGWAEPALFACIRTALDMGLFEILDEVGSKGTSKAEVAMATMADIELVARILRHLAAMNVIVEASQDVYVHTSLSSQFTQRKYRDGFIYCYDVVGPSFRGMPSFFSKTDYKQPLNIVDGPFQDAHNTTKHFFPWLAENPKYLSAFANYMAGYRDGKCPWFSPDFYPIEDQLIEGFHSPANPSSLAPFLVDVGGGKGHDLLALTAQFPNLPGRVVLQDKPEVIDSIDPPLPTNIQTISHDFFTPQPQSCRGARAYFLHSVLHDWDDENCIKILKALKSALVQGYSKILVHDLIVPDRNAAWSVTSMDWLMMALGSVREWMEADFRRLFEAAGLRITKIWIYEQGTEGIIEAVLTE